jgi:hypothetical protein
MFTRLRLFVLTIVSLVCVYPFIGNATPLKITSKERVEYQNQIRHFLQETYYTTLCLAITEQDLHKDVVEDLMAEITIVSIAKNDSMSMADNYLEKQRELYEIRKAAWEKKKKYGVKKKVAPKKEATTNIDQNNNDVTQTK